MLIYPRWTFRPERADEVQPALQPFAELSRTTVIRTAELTYESDLPEQGYAFPSFRYKAAVGQPGEQIESCR